MNLQCVDYPSDRECYILFRVIPKNYQQIATLAFAVKEINENPHLLPNFTLGFHLYDNHFTALWTYHTTMLLIYSLGRFTPNYKCDTQHNVIAVIGGLDPQISFYVATVLDIYKIPQVGQFVWIKYTLDMRLNTLFILSQTQPKSFSMEVQHESSTYSISCWIVKEMLRNRTKKFENIMELRGNVSFLLL
ncbi:hypothetical protein JRQ81_005603 [Phrynocephalus forsythii]|uniref:Receptor ligand binding region domain-containing protein n=1 Tax=Phrynocephalus forsythii TaxID=171643 RepID=A0A9Q0XIM7_9SAUR|nr:hypothetical protein JRQ81_005603 [Phrynocephalus forsythii]